MDFIVTVIANFVKFVKNFKWIMIVKVKPPKEFNIIVMVIIMIIIIIVYQVINFVSKLQAIITIIIKLIKFKQIEAINQVNYFKVEVDLISKTMQKIKNSTSAETIYIYLYFVVYFKEWHYYSLFKYFKKIMVFIIITIVFIMDNFCQKLNFVFMVILKLLNDVMLIIYFKLTDVKDLIKIEKALPIRLKAITIKIYLLWIIFIIVIAIINANVIIINSFFYNFNKYI